MPYDGTWDDAYVVMVGDPHHGYKIYGPYKTIVEAGEAASNLFEDDYWVMELHTREELEYHG